MMFETLFSLFVIFTGIVFTITVVIFIILDWRSVDYNPRRPKRKLHKCMPDHDMFCHYCRRDMWDD